MRADVYSRRADDCGETMNSNIFEAVVERLKEEEGFRSKPYHDHLGKLTIGYGCLIEDGISEEEADYLLRRRLLSTVKELQDSEYGSLIEVLPQAATDVLMDMCYNLGMPRLLGFKKMWEALRLGRYEKAADELLDSVYARQVPNRANRNADKMREAG